MAGNITEITDATFESEVINSPVPVLLDFWAPWCGPCKAIAPVLEIIATEKAGAIKICKLNVDDNPETAAKYGIRGIPTLLYFKGGELANQVTGAVPKSQIEALLV